MVQQDFLPSEGPMKNLRNKGKLEIKLFSNFQKLSAFLDSWIYLLQIQQDSILPSLTLYLHFYHHIASHPAASLLQGPL